MRKLLKNRNKYGKRKVTYTAGSLPNKKGYATMQGPGIIVEFGHIYAQTWNNSVIGDYLVKHSDD
jgi:hypothetical protein